jgi:hypothetical protein
MRPLHAGRRPRNAALILLTLASISMIAASSSAESAAQRTSVTQRASAARTESVRDNAHLRFVSANGNTLLEVGTVSGTLPGSARVTLDIGASTATSSFTFHISEGSITGYGTAKLHPGSGSYDSFGGAAAIHSGTGRYAHVSGTGDIYGVLNRANDNAEVQVIGTLRF